MLPFLKSRPQQSGMAVITRTPDDPNAASDDSGIEAAASDLISALHSKDVKATAAALKAAFELLDSMPQDETPTPEQG